MPKLARLELTKRTVDSTIPPATGETFVWDNEVRGVGLRVYSTGRRLFLYQYQTPATDQTRRLALGAYPAITAEQARELARRAASQVADSRDPKGDDVDALQRRTMVEVFPEYLAERRAKVALRTHGEWDRVWTQSLSPTFGSKRVAAIDEGMIARWHSERHSTPVAANRAVGTLSTFFYWAERRGYRPRHTNPCTNVEHYEERRRGRSLSAEEYQGLGAAFDKALGSGILPATQLRRRTKNDAKLKHRPKNADEPRKASPTIIGALRFLVLSGWREQEALSLRWDAINFERGVAVLTDTKSGRSERPLGLPALDVLRAQSPIVGNPYVFPGGQPGSYLAEPKRVWVSVKQTAQLEKTAPLRLHDLRHRFTTVARDELGLGDHVIARLVGHKLSSMTSRYGEVRDATLRTAANAVALTTDEYLRRSGRGNSLENADETRDG